MKKLIIISSILFILASCQNKNSNNNQEQKTNITPQQIEKNSSTDNKNSDLKEELVNNNSSKTLEEKVKEIKLNGEEYGDLKDFIDPNLDPEEKQKILEILKQREQRKKQIKEIFDDILENGGFDEKFSKIEKMRETCMNRILPYVKEDKKEKFLEICELANTKLKAIYYKKKMKN